VLHCFIARVSSKVPNLFRPTIGVSTSKRSIRTGASPEIFILLATDKLITPIGKSSAAQWLPLLNGADLGSILKNADVDRSVLGPLRIANAVD
jgi:hypothetical protein